MSHTRAEPEAPRTPSGERGRFHGRRTEMGAVSSALERAAAGAGSFLLLRGEAGIGKTRLLEEAVAEARRMGFATAHGAALVGSVSLYQVWAEALHPLGLDHILNQEVPPRLLGLYIIGDGGTMLASAERADIAADAELFVAMSEAVSDFIREAFARGAAASATGVAKTWHRSAMESSAAAEDVLMFSRGARGVFVFRSQGFALAGVVEGRESEVFLHDMGRLAKEFGRTRTDMEGPLREVIGSGRYDGVDLAVDGHARKLNLFENVHLGLRRKAAAQPVLLVLDDLQSADPSSLGLLQYLARNAGGDRIMLLGACRTGETAVSPELRDDLDRMAKEGFCAGVTVGPLTESDARALAEETIGPHDIPDAFFELLVRGTGGNPLFVLEVVRSLLGEGVVAGEHGRRRLAGPVDRLAVPGRIREVALRRLSMLSREERELLDAAAVCGARFGAGLVASVMGEEAGKVLGGLAAVARAHALVRPDGRYWRFDSSVAREVLYEEVPSDLRRLYHRAAAEALAASGGDPGEAGEQYAAAGDARAVPLLRGAAAGAMERGAPEEAAHILRTALSVSGDDGRAALEESLAEALEVAGRPAEAMAAVAMAEAAGTPRSRCELRRISILEKQGRWEEALRVVDAALGRAAAAEAACLLERRAFVLFRLDRYAETAKDAEEALRLFSPDEKAGRGNALNTLGLCSRHTGNYDKALSLFADALRLREEAGDRRGIAASLNNTGTVHYDRGDLDAALESYRRSRAVAAAIGFRYGEAVSLDNIGEILYEKGEPGPALEHFRKGLALRESIGARLGVAHSLHNIASVLHQGGNAAGALEYLDRGIALCRELGETQLRARSLICSVPPLLTLGSVPAARTAAEEALRLAREIGHPRMEALALRSVAEVTAEEGDAAGAGRLFSEAVERLDSLGASLDAAETLRRWGRAEKRAGAPVAARGRLSDAAARFDSLGLPGRAAGAREDMP